MVDYKLLEKLCKAVGISGDESAVREIISQYISSSVSGIHTTATGDLIAEKKGNKNGKRIMIDAHMDEVGLMVSEISDDGYISFVTVGGINSSVLLGKTVFINGNIPGVIGGKPIHLMKREEMDQAIKTEQLTIDIGAKSGKEAAVYVRPGDTVNFEPYFEHTNRTVKAKSLDDRVGCMILSCLALDDLPYDVYLSFSTREEIGSKGARITSHYIKPDICIAVEGTVAGDIPGVEGPKKTTKLGFGPAVSLMDKGTVYDMEFIREAFSTAGNEGIPCQARTSQAGSNDASQMSIAESGARAVGISVPCRYIHCPTSLAYTDDIENTYKLIKKMIERLNEI